MPPGVRSRLVLGLLSSLVLLPSEVLGALNNVTIDDTDQRVSYFPGNVWLAGSGCDGCHGRASPDPKQATGGTWHDTTQDSDIDREQAFMEIKFKGTAVYVFCILGNDLGPKTGTKADYSFFLNGNPENKNFVHTKDGTRTDYYYNTLVYSTTGLPNSDHTLKVQPNGGRGIDGSVLLLFDYALVTEDDGTVAAPQNGGGNPSSTATAASTAAAGSPTNRMVTSSTGNPGTGTRGSNSPTSTGAGGTVLGSSPGGTGLAPFPTAGPSPNNGEDVQTAASGGINKSAMTGGVIGGVLFLLAVLLAAFYLYLRRNRRRARRVTQNYPFVTKQNLFDAPTQPPPPPPLHPHVPPHKEHVSRWVAQQDSIVQSSNNRVSVAYSEVPSITHVSSYRAETDAEVFSNIGTSESAGTSMMIQQLQEEVAQLRQQHAEVIRMKTVNPQSS